ncbi:MAG: hypothetical protein JW795_09585 [Chitinivibrionales bacterium]|nr:hypothetical protein [Chitinivibrionales bacterium]
MGLRVTELTFLENFAKPYEIPAPRYLTAEAKLADIKAALESWNDEAIVKPDILLGKRGKAGAIVKVKNAYEALKEMRRIANMEINGVMTRTAYIVESIPAKMEMFTALTYNTAFLGPSLTVSLSGGMDIEEVREDQKVTIPVDVFKGLNAYEAGDVLTKLGCPKGLISAVSKALISFWDLFITTGMQQAEINPWRITPQGQVYACDFKAIIDTSNYKSNIPGVEFPEYPENKSDFEEEMHKWDESSHQGQAHVSDLHGTKILPLLFGGGASTIIIETLDAAGGSPLFLSDFGGNPPYERMYGTAKICFKHTLANAKLLLILGGKANNTFIDVTFQAIADALLNYVEEKGPISIPVVIGRGGPRLVKGILAMKQALEYLRLPYVIFGPETPVTMVAEYAAKLVNALPQVKEVQQ